MEMKRTIELLAPAKDLECGLVAIEHGADAVYIGAPSFSARSNAANSIEDIKKLVEYAHLFGARVYVALNTILSDAELKKAEKLIHSLWYKANIDALIIQDFGITQLELPPIPLHASTQMDNRTLAKIEFLEKVGFRQVVLPREFTLEQIKEVSQNVNIPLEYFIHGALCTSYSGQCYISHAFSGRSANKGACAQYCRLPYKLKDGNGKEIRQEGHFLSLKDLNLTNHLKAILEAGVSSLKIEGRLKDVSYVKNVVSHYDIMLKEIMRQMPQYTRTSYGNISRNFIPNIEKSFNRSFTSYFIDGRNEKNIWSLNSPKSLGQPIGKVVSNSPLKIETKEQLSNGDGLCYFDKNNQLQGFKIDNAETNVILKPCLKIEKGTLIYRNHDKLFQQSILRNNTAKRFLEIDFLLEDDEKGFKLSAIEKHRNIKVSCSEIQKKERSQKEQKEQIINALKKTGDTIFKVDEILISLSDDYFIPLSKLGEWKRKALSLLEEKLIEVYNEIKEKHAFEQSEFAYPEHEINYLGNVINQKAVKFYERHECKVTEMGFEMQVKGNAPLMFTKHCIKYSLGYCPKIAKTNTALDEPLTLEYKDIKLKLEFDCKICMMKVHKKD